MAHALQLEKACIPQQRLNATKTFLKERNGESLRDLWDTIKQNELCIIEVQKERMKGAESLFLEIMTETFKIWGEIWVSKVMKLISPR